MVAVISASPKAVMMANMLMVVMLAGETGQTLRIFLILSLRTLKIDSPAQFDEPDWTDARVRHKMYPPEK